MKFTLSAASSAIDSKEIELSSMDELYELVKEHGQLIFSHGIFTNTEDAPVHIMIYDDYIE